MTASVDETEDLVQDTYVKAHEKLDTFREESSLKTWILTFELSANNDRSTCRTDETGLGYTRTLFLKVPHSGYRKYRCAGKFARAIPRTYTFAYLLLSFV
jgi:hypothetical protein